MVNSKSIGQFKVSYKDLDIWMSIAGTYLGYTKMLLQLGNKKKIILPSGKKILTTITNGDRLKSLTLYMQRGIFLISKESNYTQNLLIIMTVWIENSNTLTKQWQSVWSLENGQILCQYFSIIMHGVRVLLFWPMWTTLIDDIK